jgi:HEAT repeat protein
VNGNGRQAQAVSGKASLKALLSSGLYGTDKAATKARNSPESIVHLGELLSDRSPSVRRNAGWSLYKLLRVSSHSASRPPPEVVESLGKALLDKHPDVSYAAASALSGFVRSMEREKLSDSAIRNLLSPAFPYLSQAGRLPPHLSKIASDY